MSEANDYIEIKVPAKPEYVGVIRLTLSGITSRMGFTYEFIEDIKIATSEAVTNAVHHAYQPDEDGEVVVGFGLYTDRLEIKVSDSGQSFNLEKTRRETGPIGAHDEVEFLREGGLGLYLIESLMDEVKFHRNEGVTVRMIKYLGREQVERDAERVST